MSAPPAYFLPFTGDVISSAIEAVDEHVSSPAEIA
jgi:hypothetical protein